jgi:hypothetical protein
MNRLESCRRLGREDGRREDASHLISKANRSSGEDWYPEGLSRIDFDHKSQMPFSVSACFVVDEGQRCV